MGDLDFLNLDPVKDAAPSSEPLPDGVYECAIADVQLKNTKDLTGKYLALVLHVLGGPHAKRRVWDMITVKNDNDKAVLIGRQRLAEIANAVGIPDLKDSRQIAGKIVNVKLATKPAEGQYEAKNIVKKYSAADAATAANPAAAVAKAAKAGGTDEPPF